MWKRLLSDDLNKARVLQALKISSAPVSHKAVGSSREERPINGPRWYRWCTLCYERFCTKGLKALLATVASHHGPQGAKCIELP